MVKNYKEGQSYSLIPSASHGHVRALLDGLGRQICVPQLHVFALPSLNEAFQVLPSRKVFEQIRDRQEVRLQRKPSCHNMLYS